MYQVSTKESRWQDIDGYKTWEDNKDFTMFYWKNGAHLILKTELILYIYKKGTR